MKVDEIWAEMARRKVQFHTDEKWQDIRLWGPFNWDTVSRQIKRGELLITMTEENKVIWVWPSQKSWENKIKPLIEKHTIEELATMAGCK